MATTCKTGRAVIRSPHGEILYGAVEEERGGARIAAVPLPCRLFETRAVARLAPDAPLEIDPQPNACVAGSIREALDAWGARSWGGRITLRSTVPSGVSPATYHDCFATAAVLAIADALEARCSPKRLPAFVRTRDIGLNLARPPGNAQLTARDGRVIEDFGRPLPQLRVVGFDARTEGEAPDPDRYSWWEIEAMRPIRGLLRRGVRIGDAGLVGRAAWASARLNQRLRPTPSFGELEKVVEAIGACGLQLAQRGTLGGILFDERKPGARALARKTEAVLHEMGFQPTWCFRAGREKTVAG